MRTRFVTATLILAATTALLTRPALADDRPSGAGGAYIGGGGAPTATATEASVGSTGAPGSGGGGGGPKPPCHWEVVIENDFEFGVYSADTNQQRHSSTGRWLQYYCEGYGATEVNGQYLIPEGGMVDTEALARQALASIEIAPPAIRTSPSRSGQLYVQVPTWLWLDRAWWRGYTATANSGQVWARVVAKPVSVTWQTGDGGSLTCRGAGAAWSPSAGNTAGICSHTYRRSTASAGTYTLRATVQFEVTWSSNASGGGTLPGISRSASTDVEVGEIQAIGTRGGR